MDDYVRLDALHDPRYFIRLAMRPDGLVRKGAVNLPSQSPITDAPLRAKYSPRELPRKPDIPVISIRSDIVPLSCSVVDPLDDSARVSRDDAIGRHILRD